LDSVNQNTNEIQSNYEFLCELDSKIEKLNEKVDEIRMFLFPELTSKTHTIEPLTKREQEIFLILYTSEEKELTFVDIARQVGLPPSLIKNYISNLIKKGVSIIRNSCSDGRIFLTLDKEFRAIQAKENIVKLNETTASIIH